MWFEKPKLEIDPATQGYGEPDPLDPANESSYFDVLTSARKALKFSNATNMESAGLSTVYDEHNKRVKELTGQDIGFNPESELIYGLRSDEDRRTRFNQEWSNYQGSESYLAFQRRWLETEYRNKLEELATAHPDLRDKLIPEATFEAQSIRHQAKSSMDAADAMQRYKGWMPGWTASALGSLWGQMEDPINIATLPLGPTGAGVGAKALLMTAVKAGLTNAAIEAGSQPFIWQQRTKVGLPNSIGESALAVGSAFGLGAGLDIGVRGAMRGFHGAFGHVPIEKDGVIVGWHRSPQPHGGLAAEPMPVIPDVPKELVERAKGADDAARAAQAEISRIIDQHAKANKAPLVSDGTMRQALEGHTDAIERVLAPEAKTDPVVRTMIDASRADDALTIKPVDLIDDADHAATVKQALRHVADPDSEPPPVRVDITEPSPIDRRALQAEIDDLKAKLQKTPEDPATADRLAQVEAQAKAIDTFGLDPVRDAQVIRDAQGRLPPGVDPADHGTRQARAIASLSDDAYGLVKTGEADPKLGQLVADFVGGQEYQAPILRDMMRMKPGSADEARQMIGELLRSPEYTPKPPETVGPVAEATRAPRLLDDPNGPEAKAQVQALEQDAAEELATGGIKPTPLDALKTPEGQVQAISRAAEVEATLSDMLGIVPQGATVRVFDSLEDLPGDLRIQVRAANAEAFGAALKRFQNATSLAERGLAKADLDAAAMGRGIEGISDDATIWIASYAMNPRGRLAHEALHALTTFGHLSPEEMRVLAQAAREAGIWTPDREALYRAELTNRFGADEARIAGILEEEAAAHYVEASARGELPTIEAPQTIGILERLKRLFAQVRSALIGKGFRADVPASEVDPAQEVVAALLSGRIAKAEQRAEWMRVRPDEMPTAKTEPARIDVKEPEPIVSVDESGAPTVNTDAVSRIAADVANGEDVPSAVAKELTPEISAAPMNSPEDRYINRMRAGGSEKTDAELRAQYQDKIASAAATPVEREAKFAMRAQAERGVELPDGTRIKGIALFAMRSEDKKGIRAFHGSPHDFDRFSLDKIGTGEGAQAYGHGLYFAESEAVATAYREGLSGGAGSEPAAAAAKAVKAFGGEDKALPQAEAALAKALADGNQTEAARLSSIVDHIKNRTYKQGGTIYEVNINADPEHFLDWDNPLSQHPQKIRDIVAKAVATDNVEIREVQTGWQVFVNGEPASVPYGRRQDAEARVKSGVRTSSATTATDSVSDIAHDPALTQKLKDAGIPGIKYLDQGSRAAGEGSRNYVVFDDSLIEIVSKNGVPIKANGDPLFALASSKRDMSPEARKARAEEMGFDTSRTLYHGTLSEFDEFNLAGRNGEPDRGAIFLSPSKSVASEYALGDSGQVIPVYARLKNPMIVDAGMRQGMRSANARYIAEAKANGHDGLIIRSAGHHDEVAVFDPANIRSVNAAFDPSKADSPNLMYAIRNVSEAETGKPIELRTYRGRFDTSAQQPVIGDGMVFSSSSPTVASDYARTGLAVKYGASIPEAGAYTPHVYPMDMSFKNPLVIDSGGGTYDVVAYKGRDYDMLELAKKAKADGHDGLIVRDVIDGTPEIASTVVSLKEGTTRSATSNDMMYAMRSETGRMKWGAKDRAEDLTADLKEIENQLASGKVSDRDVLQRKRAALINNKSLEVLGDEIDGYTNAKGQRDEAMAFLRAHETYGRGGFKGDDLVTLHAQLQNEALQKMAEPIWYFRKGALTGDLRRKLNKTVGNTLNDLFREAAGENTGNAMAKTFAKAWLETAEWLRQSFNAAGGDIGKLKGWFAPQYHDADALIRVGRDNWVKYMMADGVLDRERMLKADGTKLNDKDLRALLNDVWLTVTTDGANKLDDVSGHVGKGALYKRHAEHRVLHFKNADAFIKYAEDFGGGDLYAMMIGHISMMSRDIAALRRFGANPELVRERAKRVIMARAQMQQTVPSLLDDLRSRVGELSAMKDGIATPTNRILGKMETLHKELDQIRGKSQHARRRQTINQELYQLHQELSTLIEKGPLNPQQVALTQEIAQLGDEMQRLQDQQSAVSRNPVEYANSILKRADEIWKIYSGTTNTPINSTAAGITQGFRNVVGASVLSGASISAISDQATSMAARSFIGMPVVTQLGSFIKGFTQGSRQDALRLSLGLDQARNAFATQSRFSGWINTRSVTGYLADRTHALSMLSPMTQAAKTSFGWDFMTWMAGLTKQHAFQNLAPWTQDMLIRHGLTAADWKLLRSVVPENVRGVQVLSREAIATQVGEDLADKYMRVLLRERGMAVLEPTLEGRAMFISESRPGTIMGEMSRSIAMVKSFPTTYAMLILGRFYDQALEGKMARANTIAFASSILIGGTILGALVRQLKDLAYGQDPEDMTPWENPAFWGRAFMQSGGFGIFGDFIGSSTNRFGGGFATTLMGPAFDRAANLWNLTSGNIAQYATDEPTNFGRELTTFLRGNTPVIPFYLRQAYERMLLDELQKRVDPEAYRSFRRRVQNTKKIKGNDFYWPPGSFTAPRGPDFGAAFGQ